MTVEELKQKVESYRETLKSKPKAPVISSATGPVGMSLIDAVVATLESQQQQLDELKRRLPA